MSQQPNGVSRHTYRSYDPTVGRWSNRDPVGGSGNLYHYCYNDPINLVDRLGLMPNASSGSQFSKSSSQAACLCKRCSKNPGKCIADANNILNALGQAWNNNFTPHANVFVPAQLASRANPAGLTCNSCAGILQGAVASVNGNTTFGASTEEWDPWDTSALQSHTFVRIEIIDPKPGQGHCWFYADSDYGDPSDSIIHYGGPPVPGDYWLPLF